MPKPLLHFHPSLESSCAVGESTALRPSLYDDKDEFIERIGPVAVAAIYFGSFSLAPQDPALSRQALYKMSFLHRHFLQPGGLRISVNGETAILSGTVNSRALLSMADILAWQIEGIRHVKDDTTAPQGKETAREAVQFLFATDQTLRSGVVVGSNGTRVTLEGEVSSNSQKTWAEQLAQAVCGEVDSKLKVTSTTIFPSAPVGRPPQVDEESLAALVLFRLRLVRETEHVPVKVKANRGVVTLQGKVRTEALRQRVENLTRSTLGLRELRSTLSIAP